MRAQQSNPAFALQGLEPLPRVGRLKRIGKPLDEPTETLRLPVPLAESLQGAAFAIQGFGQKGGVARAQILVELEQGVLALMELGEIDLS